MAAPPAPPPPPHFLLTLVALFHLMRARLEQAVLFDSSNPTCLGHSLMGIIWGIWALYPGTFTSAIQDHRATEGIGTALLVAGVIRIICLLIRARGYLALLHRLAAFFCGLLWLQIAWSALITTGGESLAIPTYGMISLTGFWVWYRYWIQAKMQQPHEAISDIRRRPAA